MWKLLRSELSYYKLPLYLLFLYFIISSGIGFLKILDLIYRCPSCSEIYKMWFFAINIYPIYIIFTFLSLFVEMKENRIRQMSVLPIPISKIGYSRLMLPIISLLLFFSLYIFINVISISSDSVFAEKILNEHEIYVYLLYLLVYLWTALCIAYYFRLLQEWQSRIIFFMIIIIITIYLNVSNNYMYEDKVRNIVDGLYSLLYIKILVGLLPVIFSALIHWFFMIRRSYLQ
jgi:hypothetical protein